jgi:hypothetical protein
MGENRTDFFVSHAGSDRPWAEWVAWQLTDAGYTVELDAWDWSVGRNFMLAINDALSRCDRVLALFSAAYFERSRYTTEEWTAALLHGQDRDHGRLVPVRVENVPAEIMPEVLRPLLFCDLFGLDAPEARQVLLAAVTAPTRPDGEPLFPGQGRTGSLRQLGGAGPRLPGSLPRVWNLPARNPTFAGRDKLLMAVREHLVAGNKAVVQAFQGMGGVGKTQLAIEYAYRFAGAYGLAWWIDAEQAALIADQFATLGAALGCVQPGIGAEGVRTAVLGELRERAQWLLIFDNAQQAADLAGWLPGGGHVLITSRERTWAEIAAPVEVDVLNRSESVTILCDRVAGLSESDAGQIAVHLGDLPLALAQAGGFMAETGMSATQYLNLLQTQAGKLLDQSASGSSYPRSLGAATRLAADRLEHNDPAATQLASLCAFLAPEPISSDLFTGAAHVLPADLANRTVDPLAWRQTLAHIATQSLVRIDYRGLQMHRLTQAILRDRLAPEQAAVTRACTEAILYANHPGHPDDPATWGAWARLMPHLLVAELADTDNPDLRRLACDAGEYLVLRGDSRVGYDLTARLYQSWRNRLGQDDPHTWSIGDSLAWALRHMRRYAEAQELDQNILGRRRRLLGEDHHDSLWSACHLALDLQYMGKLQVARDLNRDTLARMRRTLGEDHSDTITVSANLAWNLRDLGEVQAAYDLDRDCLNRCRRILGKDHPYSLESANSVATDLRRLGQAQAARVMDEDTLARRRRVLGEDDRLTLFSAGRLAKDLRMLGQVQEARELNEDALTRSCRAFGEDHPDTLRSASNLTADLRALGDYEAARQLDEDTLKRSRRVLGEDHPDTLRSASNLTADLRALGDYEAARQLDEDTLKRSRRVLGEDHPDTLRSASNLTADLRALDKN